MQFLISYKELQGSVKLIVKNKGIIMIRKYKNSDLNFVSKIWLDTNVISHNFIAEEYWISNYDAVKEMLPKAELYVYENDMSNEIEGFIGLTDNYIEGIFVDAKAQSKGIGKQLLDYVKTFKSSLRLSVYQKNERAIRFYLREQFLIHSENIDENTNEPEFIMKWTL